MDKQVKERWVNALRSGDYQQGRAWLKKGDSYCCLGVLCDLYLVDHDMEWELNNNSEYSLDNNTEMLPKSVAKWAGIDVSDEGGVYHGGAINLKGETLAGLNDTGSPFDEIASFIEENL